MKRVLSTAVFLLCSCVFAYADEAKVQPPVVGAVAKDFELKTHTVDAVKLSDRVKEGKVVLLVLRGYPGYQCPLCTRQVAAYVAKAEEIRAAGATVLMVYPGPKDSLDKHANEFLKDTKLPAGFALLLDPDYALTSTYGLRWDAPNETAYPSTFVINKNRKIDYAKISREHGDRSDPAVVVAALKS